MFSVLSKIPNIYIKQREMKYTYIIVLCSKAFQILKLTFTTLNFSKYSNLIFFLIFKLMLNVVLELKYWQKILVLDILYSHFLTKDIKCTIIWKWHTTKRNFNLHKGFWKHPVVNIRTLFCIIKVGNFTKILQLIHFSD